MKLFVWDFHGTLEKGNENAVLEISNVVLENFRIKRKFSKQECDHLYGKKWWEYFQYLLPKEPHNKHLELQEACFTTQIAHPEIVAKHIQPNDWALDVIEVISTKHDQILISNTNPESITTFVQAIGINKFFWGHKLFAVNSHNPKSPQTKIDALKHYTGSRNFSEIIAIGDSPEDVDIVSPFNGKKYLYAHPGKTHRNAQANYKINDLRDVLREI